MFRLMTTHPWVHLVFIFLCGASLDSSAQTPLDGATIVARAKPSVMKILALDDQRQPIGSGSGFLVSADGLAVTNYQVVGQFESSRLRYLPRFSEPDSTACRSFASNSSTTSSSVQT